MKKKNVHLEDAIDVITDTDFSDLRVLQSEKIDDLEEFLGAVFTDDEDQSPTFRTN